MTSHFGFGWQPRCPACGADVPKYPDGRKAGVYICEACGASHERDTAGRLILDEGDNA